MNLLKWLRNLCMITSIRYWIWSTSFNIVSNLLQAFQCLKKYCKKIIHWENSESQGIEKISFVSKYFVCAFFFSIPALLLVYYGYHFCGFLVFLFVQMWIPLCLCFLCIFLAQFFFLFVYFVLYWFVCFLFLSYFIYHHYLDIYFLRDLKILSGWREGKDVRRLGEGKTITRIYCIERVIFNLKILYFGFFN